MGTYIVTKKARKRKRTTCKHPSLVGTVNMLTQRECLGDIDIGAQCVLNEATIGGVLLDSARN